MNTLCVKYEQMYPYKSPKPIPKGQVQFSKLKFMFSEEWNGREKIAQFEQGGEFINSPITSDDQCDIPSELQIGSFIVYVKGYTSGNLSIATTNGVPLEVVKGPREGGNPPVPPTQDLYQKLLEEVTKRNEKTPIIGENGNWFIWDGEKYIDSGNPSRGESIGTQIKAEAIDETLYVYTENGMRIDAEIKNDTLYID